MDVFAVLSVVHSWLANLHNSLSASYVWFDAICNRLTQLRTWEVAALLGLVFKALIYLLCRMVFSMLVYRHRIQPDQLATAEDVLDKVCGTLDAIAGATLFLVAVLKDRPPGRVAALD